MDFHCIGRFYLITGAHGILSSGLHRVEFLDTAGRVRMIGHLENEPLARTFSNFLYVKGIKNQVEAEADGRWALWIHAEDEIESARKLLRVYQANPNDPEIKQAAQNAQQLILQEKEKEVEARKRYYDRDRLFGGFGMGKLTLILIAISVIVFLLQEYSPFGWITEYLYISLLGGKDLPEVQEGQVWRLLTPIFLHATILHILFNMLWLRDLGSMIERRLGWIQLLLLVVAIGVFSNLAQYFVSGPAFGGMSGVVYGLLGYIWIRGKFDPSCGLFVHPSTMTMMMLWLALGYTNILPIANTVHTVGLAVGVAWGFIVARTSNS